nr:SH3 domain GRB2 endophilin B2 [Hymenolepis microstoma]
MAFATSQVFIVYSRLGGEENTRTNCVLVVEAKYRRLLQRGSFTDLQQMALSEKWQQLVNSVSLGINRATQMGDEMFGNAPKTVYDKETTTAIAYADLLNKICSDLKLQLESMFTPNPIRRAAKLFTSELNLNVPGDQPPSEKLANLLNECYVEIGKTDFSETLVEFAPGLLDLGKSEHQMKVEIKDGLLSIINDFLTSFWPDLQRERQKLDLLRLDYDWARNGKWNRDAEKAEKAKEEFERQVYVVQVLLKQCEVTRDKLAAGLLEMAKAQDRHYERCEEIAQRLAVNASEEGYVK